MGKVGHGVEPSYIRAFRMEKETKPRETKKCFILWLLWVDNRKLT